VREEKKPGDAESSIDSKSDAPAARVVSLPDLVGKTSLSAAPLLALCVGIGLGASVGIVARTHAWLEHRPV
jgi:hypothetical protein